MPEIRLLPTMYRFAGDQRTVSVAGSTLRDALGDLTSRYPELQSMFFDYDGDLSSFIKLYIDGEDVEFLQGLDSPLSADSRVALSTPSGGG